MSPVRIMYTMVTTLTHLMIQHSNANKIFTFKMANTWFDFFYTSLVLTRRICLTIKSFFSKGSFPLFSWTSGLIQGWYCQKKLEGTDTVVTAIEGERKLEIILHFYGKMLNPRFFMTKKQILRKDTIHKEMWKRLKGYCKSNLIEQKCWIAFYWLYMWSFFF